MRHILGFLGVLGIAASSFCPPALAAPFISEFMAANNLTLLDEARESSDWIEIHNPDPIATDLNGWFLTDDPAVPAKWRFPARIVPPGGFLIVFASGKDLKGPGALHTNFQLANEGEYLALVRPDGRTVASEFKPAFPPQQTDVSYGTPVSAGVTDLLAGAPLRILVPTIPSQLAADWNQPGFQGDTAWQRVPGFGLGFDPTPVSLGAGTNVARIGGATQSSTLSGFVASLALDGNPDTFTHTTAADTNATWSVDLGAEYELTKIVLRNRTSCCGSRLRDITVSLLAPDGKTVVWSSALLNPENALNSPAVLTVDFFELNVGPVPARTLRIHRKPDPDLSGGAGNADEAAVLSLGEVEAYGVESVSYAGIIRSDIGATMRNTNASVFVRVPFVIPSPDSLRSLMLNLLYDDGVVVYLNGSRVDGFNSPGDLAWNSAASTRRGKASVLNPTTVNLLEHRNLWLPGTNWLAFQGLNFRVDDPEFLLDAKLVVDAGSANFAAYLDRPTPGTSNNVSWNLGVVSDTQFSEPRGFKSAPFNLEITTATPGAEIRYTLDGTQPKANTGTIYSGPIRVDRSTVVRAAAFKDRFRPTNVDTVSYLFLSSVTIQPRLPVGFPATWAGQAGDYAMDPRIATSAPYAAQMSNSLASLPTVSIAASNDDLFGASRGIYANPERSGIAWERPISLEWMTPGGGLEFQADCGLRIQGGYFRQRGVTRKHSLRLLFKDEYGPGRLRQDLFRDFGAAREFDTLVLRAGANDGYAWDAARDTEQFARDQFGRDILREMGQPSGRGRFVHVYINGLYWGVYNLTERPAEDFSATYMGGNAGDWDAINSGDVKSGSLDAWNQFITGVRAARDSAAYLKLQGLNPDASRNPTFPVYLDADNYQDYMLLNIWGGNWDWPNKNFWFGRNRTATSDGFKFYLWDFENTMGNNRDRSPLRMVAPRSDVASSWVGEPHSRLSANPEYRIGFADRVQRHFFNGGPLSPEALVARYRALAAGLESAIVAESARWGDEHFSPPQDLTDWQRERDWLLNTYLPQRTAIVLNQFRSQGLYPSIDAPVLSQHGGRSPDSGTIEILASGTELLYSTNGIDPRLPGGGIHPSAIRITVDGTPAPSDPHFVRSGREWRYLDTGVFPGNSWINADFNDSAWKLGKSQLGYGDNDEATVVGFVDANPTAAGVQRNATTLFRTSFEVSETGAFEKLRLSVTYDDAVAVYLNGREIFRSENLPSGAAFAAYATSSAADNSIATVDNLPATHLLKGRNVIAAEVHQSDGGSSDISFDLELTGNSTSTGKSIPIRIPANAFTLKVRTRQGTDWSALTEAAFVPGIVPANATNLVISEFCYRPADASTPAERAVTTDRDDFEFIELLNRGGDEVDLSPVRFSEGVLFEFPAGTTLKPGERILVVRNATAFQTRYGSVLRIAGEYDGRLDNSGEELRLVGPGGSELRSLNYRDGAPWPNGANRNGYSLVLRRPQDNPNHALPENWRSSSAPGGNPGKSDSTTFAGAPDADINENGQADLIDHAMGFRLGPEEALRIVPALVTHTNAGMESVHFTLTYPWNPVADDTAVDLEIAASPSGPWVDGRGQFEFVSEERLITGLSRVTVRKKSPIDRDSSTPVFVRLVVARLP